MGCEDSCILMKRNFLIWAILSLRKLIVYFKDQWDNPNSFNNNVWTMDIMNFNSMVPNCIGTFKIAGIYFRSHSS